MGKNFINFEKEESLLSSRPYYYQHNIISIVIDNTNATVNITPSASLNIKPINRTKANSMNVLNIIISSSVILATFENASSLIHTSLQNIKSLHKLFIAFCQFFILHSKTKDLQILRRKLSINSN